MFWLYYTYPGPPPINVDKTSSYLQSPLGDEDLPPPIPPQKFSGDDILLLPKLSESYKLQQDGRDAPPLLTPKTNQEDTTASPCTPKKYSEDTTVLPLPSKTKQNNGGPPPRHPKTSEKAASLPTPPLVNQKNTTLPSHPSNEGTALVQHPTELTTVRSHCRVPI